MRCFTLSEHGQVQGEIRVPQAMINGHVTGDVHVSARLELAAHARIDGDLRYHTMEMAAGAQVNGSIARQADDSTARTAVAKCAGDGGMRP
jgi:cytoskeletal protein CcmA (bactofilin family)